MMVCTTSKQRARLRVRFIETVSLPRPVGSENGRTMRRTGFLKQFQVSIFESRASTPDGATLIGENSKLKLETET
jgi:hypothetical protein